MYRDPSEFRLRFKAYKDGKSVREIYGLPGYEPGKLPVEEMMPYILAVENPTKQGLVNGVWRPPTDSTKWDVHAIGGGLDIREQHNPIVYNYLKTNGRLGSPFLTAREEEVLREKVFKKTMLPALQNVYNKYGDKISSKGYARLAGMKWQGHPFLMAISPDSVTGKAFIKAIESGDKDLDSVFDAYYKYPANAKRYAARILADTNYWKNHNTVATKPVPQDPIIARQDATRVSTIPTVQLQAIDYSDRRNAVAAEAERAIWAHNVMEDMKGAYQVPIWESPSLPALTPVEYDAAPFKYNSGKLPGYQNGYIQQGKTRPIVYVANRLRRKPEDGVIIGTIKNGLSDVLYDVDESFLSLRNIENFGGTGWDWANVLIGSSFGTEGYLANKTAKEAVKATKTAVKNAAKKAIKPVETSIKKAPIPETSTPTQTGRFLDEHPEFHKNVNLQPAKKVTNDFYVNDLKPRWESRGVHIGFDPNQYNLIGADMGKAKQSAIIATDGHGYIDHTLSPEQLIQANLHEVDGHLFNRTIDEAAKKSKVVRKHQMQDVQAVTNEWKFPKWFLDKHEDYPVGEEARVLNRESRFLFNDWNNIEKVPISQFYNTLNNSGNAAIKAVINNPEVDLYRLRNVVANIPAIGAPLYVGMLTDEYKNGKLPGYSNGKIRIKPANRGKFNATKKRTGKTTEELTHSRNPLTRKRAIFAQNAKKWKHK